MDNLVVIGFTSCGKSTIGRHLARRMHMHFIDLDRRLEQLYTESTGTNRRCREIFQIDGPEVFREWEARALASVTGESQMVLATGGGAPLREENRPLLKSLGRVLYLRANPETLFGRMERKGLPGYLANDPTVEGLAKVWAVRHPIYQQLADLVVETDSLTVGNAVSIVLRNLQRLPRPANATEILHRPGPAIAATAPADSVTSSRLSTSSPSPATSPVAPVAPSSDSATLSSPSRP